MSVGTAALTCAMFATGAAVVVMPAALVLFGRRINAFSFPAPRFLQSIWSGLLSGGNWVTRHALYAGFAATALLAALAIPALSLKSGQESVKQLPKNAQARIAFEEVSHVMGAGWATPFTLVVVVQQPPDHDSGAAGEHRQVPAADREEQATSLLSPVQDRSRPPHSS